MKDIPTFANDIMPLFYPYRFQMMWRLDLTDYDDVKANAPAIYTQMQQGYMPPPPFTAFTPDQAATFQTWMRAGYPK